MKSSMTLMALLTLPLLLAGCSSDKWRIQLKDGREYAATSQPEYQLKTGYYRYRNASGKDALLRAEEVLQVERL